MPRPRVCVDQTADGTFMPAYKNHTKQQLISGNIAIGMGMRFILSSLDLVFLMRGARERSEFLHGLKL